MSATDLPANVQALDELPGHYIRRLQQIAAALFMEETQELGITPVQFAAMTAVHREPGMDQRTLASRIAFDTSTIGSVLDRLEARGLIRRNNSPTDRRVRLLTLTEAGVSVLEQVQSGVRRTQERILEPLPAAQRKQFMAMLHTLVHASRAPGRADGKA